MMLGRSTTGAATTAYTPVASSSSNGSGRSNGGMATAIILAGALILYVIWALVERHEKVQDAIKPGAIALNLRNLLAIMLPVLIGIPLIKIASIKYQAIGGPGGSTITKYTGSL